MSSRILLLERPEMMLELLQGMVLSTTRVPARIPRRPATGIRRDWTSTGNMLGEGCAVDGALRLVSERR